MSVHNPPDCTNHDLNAWCGLHGDPDDVVLCPPDHYADGGGA